MVGDIRDRFGPVGLLVNNAGIATSDEHDEFGFEEWARMFAVNVDGPFLTTWAVKGEMITAGFGRIVNISSLAAHLLKPNMIHYATTKAAVIAFTRHTAVALAEHNIRVNCLAPGAYTRMTKDLPGFSGMDEEAQEKMGPRWIAVTTAWLCSPAAQNVTGRVFDIMGQRVGISEQWHLGPTAMQTEDPADMTDVIAGLMADAQLNSNMGGNPAEGPGRPGRTI